MTATRRTFLLTPLALPLAAASRIPNGEYWRQDALNGIMRHWAAHARDPNSGLFHGNLTRDWKPLPPLHRIPLLIGRHVYGFSTAFQLSGDAKFLEVAREGASYLLEHAWDREFGGWHDSLDQTGEAVSQEKTVARQIYVNAGLAAYYTATGDIRALRRVLRSVELQRIRAHDPEHGGWAETFHRDMNVASWGKNKHAHYDYAGALLLNLHLATRDPSVLAWARELMDLSLSRMRDPCGWFHGFRNRFDREWRHVEESGATPNTASTGAQLTAALSLIRLYEQSRHESYLHAAVDLVEQVQRFGWNQKTGAWSELVGSCPASRIPDQPAVWWWVQMYGTMAQLRLFATTQDTAWLRGYQRSDEFFERVFRDREFGGVYASVTPQGSPAETAKASAGAWKTSYHEMEHALVKYLYLSLYVNRQPARLQFQLDGPGQHYVSLVDDPNAAIERVLINGKPSRDFDAAERSVQTPAGSGTRVETWLAPPVARSMPRVGRRRRILQQMQLAMGGFPSRVRLPLDMEVLDEVQESGYSRRNIRFTVEQGDRLSAYLLIPDRTSRRLPAAVCLHPTHREGKGVPVGLAGDPGRNYAHELAQRGFVTLAPDYPGFGGYTTDPYDLGYAGATAKGIWNHMRAIDLLASLKEVDPQRVFAVGHSLGGHNALFLAAFDTRVKGAVTSCGFTSFRKYMGGNLTGWSHRGYMPRIAAVYGASPARMPFEFSDVLIAIAPRPVFVSAPLRDDNFDASGVDDAVNTARAAGAVITVIHPDAAHSFPDEARTEAYRFLEQL
jgi:mannose/cellobiose epimerase-like protein (N-acyl-D-glucosamine 2-epimerase family)/dienelactone hydrolase